MEKNEMMELRFPEGTIIERVGSVTRYDGKGNVVWTVPHFVFKCDISGAKVETVANRACGGNGAWIYYQNNTLRKCATEQECRNLSGKVVRYEDTGRTKVLTKAKKITLLRSMGADAEVANYVAEHPEAWEKFKRMLEVE